MSNASSSRRKSQNSSTFNASKKRDVIRNTILLKYKGVTPMIVPRSDSYPDMVATARKHLAKTRAEVRNAATANIRLMGQHPAYGAQLVEITDDVWGELHRDLTEFTISIPDPLEADIIMLSDDEKQDYATPATGSTPSLTVDTPLDDRSPSPQISPPVSGSVAAAPPASRGKKRKASSHDVPSGHDKKGPPKIGKPTSSRRRKDIVNNAFVELSAKPTDPGKGKQREVEPDVSAEGSDESDVDDAIDIDSNALTADGEGYHSLASHLKLEAEFIDSQRKRFKDNRLPWLAPPLHKHEAIRAYLRDSDAEGLTEPERHWVGNHRLRGRDDDERPILAPGEPLRVAMVWAHAGHAGALPSYAKLREKYLCPSRDFVKLWVRQCPTCRRAD